MLIDLKTALRLSPIPVTGVIHVGAHHGWEYPAYKESNITDLVMIEPLPSNFEQLAKNVGPECQLFNVALGAADGYASMHVESDNMGQSCSLLEPVEHLRQYPHIRFTGHEEVKVVTLDSLPIQRERFQMLNMDVQGYELEVLKGGLETLPHISVIYAEVNRAEVYRGCVMVEELDAFLAGHGFRRAATSWAGGSWGDAVYLRLP